MSVAVLPGPVGATDWAAVDGAALKQPPRRGQANGRHAAAITHCHRMLALITILRHNPSARDVRVAVFCDGDFWHGRDWSARRVRIASGANSDYWIAKIESNMQRDRLSTSHLQRLGWRVIRVWETDVLRSPVPVASHIIQVVHQRRGQPASRAGREARKLALAHPSPSRLARTRPGSSSGSNG